MLRQIICLLSTLTMSVYSKLNCRFSNWCLYFIIVSSFLITWFTPCLLKSQVYLINHSNNFITNSKALLRYSAISVSWSSSVDKDGSILQKAFLKIRSANRAMQPPVGTYFKQLKHRCTGQISKTEWETLKAGSSKMWYILHYKCEYFCKIGSYFSFFQCLHFRRLKLNGHLLPQLMYNVAYNLLFFSGLLQVCFTHAQCDTVVIYEAPSFPS